MTTARNTSSSFNMRINDKDYNPQFRIWLFLNFIEVKYLVLMGKDAEKHAIAT